MPSVRIDVSNGTLGMSTMSAPDCLSVWCTSNASSFMATIKVYGPNIEVHGRDSALAPAFTDDPVPQSLAAGWKQFAQWKTREKEYKQPLWWNEYEIGTDKPSARQTLAGRAQEIIRWQNTAREKLGTGERRDVQGVEDAEDS